MRILTFDPAKAVKVFLVTIFNKSKRIPESELFETKRDTMPLDTTTTHEATQHVNNG